MKTDFAYDQVREWSNTLDSALEHAAHAWAALEQEKKIQYMLKDAWPPHIKAPVGSLEYHLAAMIGYVFKVTGAPGGMIEQLEEEDKP